MHNNLPIRHDSLGAPGLPATNKMFLSGLSKHSQNTRSTLEPANKNFGASPGIPNLAILCAHHEVVATKWNLEHSYELGCSTMTNGRD